MTTFRPTGFHLGPASPTSTEATGPRVWDVQQLCSVFFFLLSLITQDVVETHRAASNSLKLSSWNGAQDTHGIVPSRCANHIERRAREQTGSGSSYATANFSECSPVYWDAAALKETRARGTPACTAAV